MPIIKSAKKRVRQTVKRKARNQNLKRELRTEIKALMAAVGEKNSKKAAEQLTRVQSQLDKAVKKNILKKNTAARKLSQLSDKVKATGAKPSTAKPRSVTKSSKSTPASKAKPAAKKPAAKKTTAKKAPAKTATK